MGITMGKIMRWGRTGKKAIAFALGFLLAAVVLPNQVLAQSPPVSNQKLTAQRAGALAALTSKETRTRLQAVYTLAGIGKMQDSERLVALLKDASPVVSEAANDALLRIWARSDNEAVQTLFEVGVGQLIGGLGEDSIATFSDVIRRKPDFAEGWNKRATVYFMLGEYTKSLADCDEVIKRNPLHFGALAGYGQIYLRLGDRAKALKYFEQAYAINPTMRGVEETIEQLRAFVSKQVQT
jgi:tetratricopeptide (TPR) repeat protein